MPRRITDFVGDIENPRFENGSLRGDLFFHMLTDESRDTLSLVKGGIEGHIQPVSFSIEHEGKEIYMKESGHYTTDSLLFHGGAIVDEGASGGTKIMGEGMSDNVRYLSKFKQTDKTELEEIKTEVETMLDEETKAEIMAMIKEAIAGQAPVEEPPKEMAEEGVAPEVPVEDVKVMVTEEVKAEIAPLEEKVAAIEQKVMELSKKPAPERTLAKPMVEDVGDRVVLSKARIVPGTITGVN